MGFVIMVGYLKYKSNTATQIPRKIVALKTHFSLANAPSQSVHGSVVSMTGIVNWQFRTATQASHLTSLISLQQGENIVTENVGTAHIQFADTDIFLSPKTEVDFIQMLPSNFVIAQTSGSAEYKTTGTTPISVRSLGLIVQILNADATITYNATETKLTVQILKGSATAAYNDLDNLSNVIPFTSGQTLIFDNGSRTHLVR